MSELGSMKTKKSISLLESCKTQAIDYFSDANKFVLKLQ